MGKYSHIIANRCREGSRSSELLKSTIPILVGWAKHRETNHTYGDLNKLLGYSDGRNSFVGELLGYVSDVLDELSLETGEEIPTLNGLINSAKTKLPSDGFGYVYHDYEDLDHDLKKIVVATINNKACEYDGWDWVLASLGLKPSLNTQLEESIRTGEFGYSTEGEEHKRLKKYVANNPRLLETNIKGRGVNEHILLSGDRLDVYFPFDDIAVEVKPASAPESDVLRGLFQCVKYKAILDAEAEVKGLKPNSRVFLVLGGKLSDHNRSINATLSVRVIENIRPR